MIAQLKYGSGTPFYRLEQLQGRLGTSRYRRRRNGKWSKRRPSYLNRRATELIRQAAQGEVVHNDDTSMRVLHLTRAEPVGRAHRCIHQRHLCPPARVGRLRCTSLPGRHTHAG